MPSTAHTTLAGTGLYGPMCNHLTTQLSIAKKMSRVEGWSEIDETTRRERYFSALLDDLKVDRALFSTALQRIPVTDDPDGIEARSVNTFGRFSSEPR